MSTYLWLIGRMRDGKAQILEHREGPHKGKVRAFDSKREAEQVIKDEQLGDDCFAFDVPSKRMQ